MLVEACYGTHDDLEDIGMIRWFDPAAEHSNPAWVPTRIAYSEENVGKIDSLHWGYGVGASLVSHSGSRSFIEPMAGDITVQKYLQASHKTLADFLRKVYKYIHDFLEVNIGPVLSHRPVTYCFTLPTMCSAKTMNGLVKVFETAGFKSRPEDRIQLVTESEAAALVVLTQLDADDVEPIKVRFPIYRMTTTNTHRMASALLYASAETPPWLVYYTKRSPVSLSSSGSDHIHCDCEITSPAVRGSMPCKW